MALPPSPAVLVGLQPPPQKADRKPTDGTFRLVKGILNWTCYQITRRLD